MNVRNKSKKLCMILMALMIAALFVIPGSALEFTATQSTPSVEIEPTTIYVDGSNTQGPWDGSLEHPYQFIQDGIYAAEPDDTVYVFPGTYKENPSISIPLDLVGDDADTTFIDGQHIGSVIQITADHVMVSGFTVMNGGSNSNNAGVMLQGSYNLIVQNTIQRNMYFGVYAAYADNTIYHNNFVENTYPAFDVHADNTWDDGFPSGGNYWSDYTGVDNDEDGIGDIPYPTGNSSADHYPLMHPYGSVINENTSDIFLSIKGAITAETTLNGHLIFVKNGDYKEHVLLNKTVHVQGENVDLAIIDGQNTGTVVQIVNDSVQLTGFTITRSGNESQDAGINISATGCLVSGNVITDDYLGIQLTSNAIDAMVSQNVIESNRWNGVMIEQGCTGASIIENYIADNFFAGIGVTLASNNIIYHNSLLRNKHNAYDDGGNIWDNGYPSGGNYWDDYRGVDLNHGPAQDEPGSDGIGDTPYKIPSGDNKDRYPLMAPYTPKDTTPPTVEIVSPQNGLYLRNLQLFPRLLSRTIIFGRITVVAEAYDLQTGISKVEFCLDSVVNPEAVITQPPYEWTWTKRVFLNHEHTISVIAFDNAGNFQIVSLQVHRYF